MAPPPKHRISFLTCCSLVVANMIGTGVYTSLGFQLVDIKSAASIVLLWIIGGIIAVCGALSYTELAVTFPRSGGEYNFLSRIYHPSLGFAVGLISATVGFAAPVALAAMAFGKYLSNVIPGISVMGASATIVLVVTCAHLFNIKMGSIFQNVITLLNLLLIVVFVVIGFSGHSNQSVSFLPSSKDAAFILSAPFAVSLMFVMYAYSGWNALTYIIDEISDLRRAILPAAIMGTVFVAIGYILLNAVFLYRAPMSALAGQMEVAHIAGVHIFGAAGAKVTSTLICVGLIACVSAMTWIGPRVSHTMGQDLKLLSFLAKTNSNGIPIRAILLQMVFVFVLVFSSTFERVMLYTQFTLLLSSFLCVLGLIVARYTLSELERPIKCPAYPLPPIAFLIMTGFAMLFTLWERPTESLMGLGTFALGLALYFLMSNSKKLVSTALLLLFVLAVFSTAQAQPVEASPNDWAQFLGGYEVKNEKLAQLQNTKAWKWYSSEISKDWEALKRTRLEKMQEWGSAELGPHLKSSSTVYYTFSGPDFLSVYALYPEASSYILSGLEPVGEFSSFESLDAKSLTMELQNLRNSLRPVMQLSFFRTKDMEIDFKKGKLKGVLPVLLMFLARSSNTVLLVENVYLDEKGNVHNLSETNASLSKTPINGVKILFTGPDKKERHLYYFSANLGNSGINKEPGLVNFMKSFGRSHSYLKAASYLMYRDSFSSIRSFLLNNSATFLQDDSGIPYKFFNQSDWNIQLYGTYTSVIPLFIERFQPDLRKAYNNPKKVQIKTLPFSTGYMHYRSNLMLAIKLVSKQYPQELSISEAFPLSLSGNNEI